MSNVGESKARGFFLVFLVGLAVGIAGALLLPPYLPSSPWTGKSVEGTVLDKESQSDRLLMRVASDEGLILATFSQKQDDIDLLVQPGDRVQLRVRGVEPFVTDPVIEHVRRPDPGTGAADGAASAERSARQRTLEALEARLTAWEAEIERLRAVAEEAGDDAQARGQELVGELETKSGAARARLAELRRATGSAWQELRTGVERAWAELEESLAEAGRQIEEPSEADAPEEGDVDARRPPPDQEP